MIKNYDLSVLISARNEEFLARTVEDVLNKRRGNTEVIVVADGYWPNPPVIDHPDVTLIHHEKAVGQRAGINDAARVSRAKFVMKLDAHCILDEGFDVKLMADCEYDWTVVPAMYNLHAFDWKCKKCGSRWYQGPTPEYCQNEDRSKNEKCNSKEFERVMVWKKREHKRSEFMTFDSELHFQYWGEFKERPEAKPSVAPLMSFLGACWFMHRERYWELEGLDERHGSWGQVGTEVACKAWLSGGKLMLNKNTWFAHLFRTQGGDFSFPYPQSGRQVDRAREHSKEMWRHNKWPKAKHNLRWLVEKFWPVKGWTQADLDKLPKEKDMTESKGLTKGIVYYTDNKLNVKLAHLCKNQLKKVAKEAGDIPIVSVSLKPLDLGKNIVLPLERGYLTMFKQILVGLEASDADIIYFCEHDWLYPVCHFDFVPPRKDVFYYNTNWWRLRSGDGLALRYESKLLPGIVAYRELLVEHYRKKVALVEAYFRSGQPNFTSFVMRVGFEPGTHNRAERVDNYGSEEWESCKPIIDIRHESNLTKSKWKKEDFVNQKYTRGWTETKNIPGWGVWDAEHKRFK